MQTTPLRTLPLRLAQRAREVWPGVLLTALIAILATGIGQVVPILGSAIPAVVIGVVVGSIRKPPSRLAPGIRYSSKFLLQGAVVLLGAQLSLASIVSVGAESLPVMLTSLTVCLVAAWGLGKLLGIDRDTKTLIGVGTGICGASAIAAVAPVIRAKSSDISYALSTIFLFNLIAVLVFPLIGHTLGMTPHTFGLFAGTAVNDTSSVVAAASVFRASALGFAVVVKLVRTLMIIPISVTLAIVEERRDSAGKPITIGQFVRLIPWFLIGFLIVAAVSSFGVLSEGVTHALSQVSIFLIATALAGIGLSTDLRAIRTSGFRPLVLGGTLSLLVAVTTLLMMGVLGYF